MNFNEIQYGNCVAELLPYINGSSFLDHLFADCSRQFNFPANDSPHTREELNSLLEYQEQLQKNPSLQQRFFAYDENIYEWFCKQFFQTAEGQKDEEKTNRYLQTIKDLFTDCLPLIYKLKMHFNRPRPFQLAGYYKLKLFPSHSFSVNSPAYPSMYSCMAAVVALVCGNHYPDMYKYFMDLKNDIAYSRLYMAANFQSDIDAGYRLAQRIGDNNEFKIKYKL
jgi:hypothetical protein